MMNIDINTKFITLIGDPLGQSFAARMQNAGYEAAGLNLKYFYTETGSEHLGDIINGIRYMPSFAGCAITKPNKVKVLEFLDELDPLCRKMGSCNTILRTGDNKLKGYNTDGMGFNLSINNETELELENITCFCIGAGGAGRAICSSVANNGAAKIYITDKFEECAKDLVCDINKYFAADGIEIAEFVPFGDYGKIGECSLIINASGIGMGKTIGQSPIPAEIINESQFCYDACYNPARTQFLIDAEAKGCKVLNGLGMSLYQGAAQIKIWSGQDAPIDEMKAELEKIISGS